MITAHIGVYRKVGHGKVGLRHDRLNFNVFYYHLAGFLRSYHSSGSCSMLPSVMGLSASPKALALYWMQSMVRSS